MRRHSDRAGWRVRDDRGLAPVVGKAFEAGIVVLYVALITATLYGSVVPDYRTTAGDAVADRALATAALGIERAIPDTASTVGTGAAETAAVETVAVETTVAVALPATIRGEPYRVRATGERLVLVHPHPAIGGSVRLALPDRVHRVQGEWRSTEANSVYVTGNATRLTIELQGREART